MSNRSKASLISCFCSSVSSNFFDLAPPRFADACTHAMLGLGGDSHGGARGLQ